VDTQAVITTIARRDGIKENEIKPLFVPMLGGSALLLGFERGQDGECIQVWNVEGQAVCSGQDREEVIKVLWAAEHKRVAGKEV
jgi:hypothetical protein